MKKLKKKIRRHPKPEKLITTVICAFLLILMTLAIFALGIEKNTREAQIYQSKDE